jgi:hypothetical protein
LCGIADHLDYLAWLGVAAVWLNPCFVSPMRDAVSMRVSLLLAGRALARSNYGIAAATTLMLLLIYVSMLFLPSLIQGAINRVNAALVDTLTSNIVITPASKGTIIDDAGPYLASIRGIAGVAAATPVYHAGTQVSYGANSGSWTVDAIDPASYGQVFTTPRNLIEGHDLTASDTGQVLLGIGIAGAGQTRVHGYRASLQAVHAGDKVTITLTSGKAVTFTVAGIFNDQFPQADTNAYITMNEAQKLLPASTGRATAIYVRTRSGTTDSQEVSRLTPLRGGMKFQTSADRGGDRPGPDRQLRADQRHPQGHLAGDGRHHHLHHHLHRPGQQAPPDRHRASHRHQVQPHRAQLRPQGLGLRASRRRHRSRALPPRCHPARAKPPLQVPQRTRHPGHHLERDEPRPDHPHHRGHPRRPGPRHPLRAHPDPRRDLGLNAGPGRS